MVRALARAFQGPQSPHVNLGLHRIHRGEAELVGKLNNACKIVLNPHRQYWCFWVEVKGQRHCSWDEGQRIIDLDSTTLE